MDTGLEISALTIEECISEEQLQALGQAWSVLWTRCPQATPFQSPEWLIPWWRHFGQSELWVLLVHHEENLVGLAPFFVESDSRTGERTLLLLGTGISDYLDPLFLPGYESIGATAVISHLEANADCWDRCDFQQLPGSSALLGAAVGSGLTSEVSVQEVCPVLKLPSDTRELPGRVPTHMLQKLRYYRRRLARTTAVRVEQVHEENFGEFFANFIRLHQARWSDRAQSGALETDNVQTFHREAARNLLTIGALRLYALSFDHEIAATLYGFSHQGRAFYYLSGFDPQFAEFSPGTVMIGYAIEQAIAEGAGEFDFLRGREAYKYMWGAKGRLNYRRQLWHAE